MEERLVDFVVCAAHHEFCNVMMGPMQFLTVYLSFISFVLSVKPCFSDYTAAVYEHVTFFVIENKTEISRPGALEIMKKNLAVFQTKAVLAKSKGAEIIVFPEDGLYGFDYTREQIFPFLEIIPNPSQLKESWNPCTDPDRFDNTEVLRELSCIARNSTIAVVANMGDVQYCNKSDPHCPEDGRYQFNTDVVFDTDGTLLAKYHKQHLFHEDQFNTPQKAEIVIFKTSFGVKFGVFTCFDMLYYDPAIELVEKFGVRNIVFPTAWMDGFPILASIEYQQAWSRLTCVNLLAANQHLPLVDMIGSGIYSCGEALSYVYDMKTYEGHLLVARLPDLELHPELPILQTCQSRNVPLNWQQYATKQMGSPFHSKLLNDIYTFVTLDGTKGAGTASVCNNELCCHASYILASQQSFENELFALGAFNGHHDPEGYIIQACVLIKCNSMEKDSCGSPTQTSSTIFSSFQLTGNFSAKAYVFPEVLASDVELIPAKMMSVSGNVMSVNSFEKPLLSAVLFGRIYELDHI